MRVQEEATGYRIQRRPVKQWRITFPRTGTASGADVAAYVQNLVNRDPGSDYMVSSLINRVGWRSSQQFRQGDEVSLLRDPHAYDMVGGEGSPLEDIRELLIFAMPRMAPRQPGGGCRGGSKSMDCFWRALSKAFGGHLPVLLRSDKALREAVGAPPPGTLFPATVEIFRKVESYLPKDVELRVSGTVPFASGRKGTRIVRIFLHNEHFTLLAQEGRERSLAVAHPTGLKPVRQSVVEGDGATLYGLDDAGNLTAEPSTKAAVLEWKRMPYSAPYLLTKPFAYRADYGTVEEYAAASLRARAQERAELLEATGRDLDCFVSRREFALEYFRTTTRTLPASAPLEGIEEAAVDEAMRGGLVWAARDYHGPAVSLDIVSFYPSILAGTPTMKTGKTLLPFGAGTPAYLRELPEHPSVGFYRVRATVPDRVRALWRGPPSGAFGWVTQVDISTARMLHCTVELAPEEEGANAITYQPRQRLAAREIFGHWTSDGRPIGYVPKLFEAKRKGSAAAKKVLNMIWGALAQRAVTTAYISADRDEDEEDIDIPAEPTKISRYPDGGLKIEYPAEGARFVGPYPRFAPFILAAARARMAEMLAHHVERVVYLHTDGFVLAGDELPAGLRALVGVDLGQLKEVRRGEAHVVNASRVIWP